MSHNSFSFCPDDDIPPEPRSLKPLSRQRTRKHEVLPSDIRANHDDEPLPLWQMKMTQPVLRELLDFLLSREPEAAGLLLGPANDDLLITHFKPDLTGRGTPASFELGTSELNVVLKQMKMAGINCKGIAHSHPAGAVSPSYGDLQYLRRVFGLPANVATSPFYMPIVCSGRLYPYVYAHGQVWCCDLVLI